MKPLMAPGASPQRPSGDQPARRPIQIYSFDPMLANTLERIGPAKVTVGIPVGTAQTRAIRRQGPGRRFRRRPHGRRHIRATFLRARSISTHRGTRLPRAGCHRPRATRASTSRWSTRSRCGRSRLRQGASVGASGPAAAACAFPARVPRAERLLRPGTRAVLFGYFTADVDDPGPNLPGQTVFTCLSHDIISHEVTHAPRSIGSDRSCSTPTNADVPAFHEAIADIIAILQHFTLPDVVERHDPASPAPTHGRRPAGRAGPAVRVTPPGKARRCGRRSTSPTRGATQTSSSRTRGGPSSWLPSSTRSSASTRRASPTSSASPRAAAGILPAGRAAARPRRSGRRRGGDAADRGADDVPCAPSSTCRPYDVTFGDFLRALVTADRELFPTDAAGTSHEFIDALPATGHLPGGRDLARRGRPDLAGPQRRQDQAGYSARRRCPGGLCRDPVAGCAVPGPLDPPRR